jgi:hypothetical protein
MVTVKAGPDAAFRISVLALGMWWPCGHELREEVAGMPRYLLVLDMDLLPVDKLLDPEPVSYLMARQEEQPCEVTVLSVAGTRRARLSGWERVLGGAAANISPLPVKLPMAPGPGHDVSTAAEHHMHAAVRQLETVGCQASGIISDEDLVKAVQSVTRGRRYDEVILATGSEGGTRLARVLGRDPVHQLRRRWGRRLIVFSHGPGTISPAQNRN